MLSFLPLHLLEVDLGHRLTPLPNDAQAEKLNAIYWTVCFLILGIIYKDRFVHGRSRNKGNISYSALLSRVYLKNCLAFFGRTHR